MFLLLYLAIVTFAFDKKWLRPMGDVEWSTFSQATEKAQRRKLPILGFFSGLECAQCSSYFEMFNYHPTFKQIAKRFVLAALDETDPSYNMSPLDQEGYSPKFVFFDSHGKILDFSGYDDPLHKYFCTNIEFLLEKMGDVDDYAFDHKDEL
ncbi:hypothetical protein EIN_185160 [Entamoeba invadens IP1]|uniref:hypothetical protein n=1 Tax=Entamoeba invadens IP1 TaxID=370355 RepID=UPI0002C3FC14|nr:hypothetical protein EIN_185160 [Entamoeba invadens IP1]ELP94139.1 hypothetical protein EIN_185160 [Entamoeba invadens IP1]|eukprot:XP_004260910.1 hypothetical protein EIN_185160 [Entamoeba invadens IP1]